MSHVDNRLRCGPHAFHDRNLRNEGMDEVFQAVHVNGIGVYVMRRGRCSVFEGGVDVIPNHRRSIKRLVVGIL